MSMAHASAVDVDAEWMDHALPDAGTVLRAGQN
jgi:hypothetical protein